MTFFNSCGMSIALRVVVGSLFTVFAALLAFGPMVSGEEYWPLTTLAGLFFLFVLFWDAAKPLPSNCVRVAQPPCDM